MSRGGDGRFDLPERARVQRPNWPAADERARFRTLGKDRFKDRDYQRYVQSFRSHASLSEAGRKGYDATVARHGLDYTLGLVAAWRRDHPSREEQRMHDLLDRLGVEPYRTEHRIWPLRIWVDVAWPTRQQAIEIYGGVHFGPIFDPDGKIAAHDQTRQERIEAEGWEVLIVTAEDLRRENLPGTGDVIVRFLEREEATPW